MFCINVCVCADTSCCCVNVCVCADVPCKNIHVAVSVIVSVLMCQVIHMVSAANGAELFYCTDTHTTRYEGLEHARDLDRATAQVSLSTSTTGDRAGSGSVTAFPSQRHYVS